jgi:hypothetical protein
LAGAAVLPWMVSVLPSNIGRDMEAPAWVPSASWIVTGLPAASMARAESTAFCSVAKASPAERPELASLPAGVTWQLRGTKSISRTPPDGKPMRPVALSTWIASCQAVPSALTLTAKSSLPARPISALPS